MKFPIGPSSSNSDFKNRFVIAVLAIFALNFLLPSVAYALPWDTATQKIACELSGSTLKWLAVIAIVLAGIMFGLGELSGPFQRFMQIAGGFSIAVSAVSVVGWMIQGGKTISECTY